MIDMVKGTRQAAARRKMHVRKKVRGTAQRPRLTVFRSNRNIYAQIVDDTEGVTLMAANTKTKVLRGKLSKAGNVATAFEVGQFLGKQAISVGIKFARFDRGPYKYHGRVKAVAEGARKAGLSL
jgi:large subunit ribosomal protein L18